MTASRARTYRAGGAAPRRRRRPDPYALDADNPRSWGEDRLQKAITDYIDELDEGLQRQYPGAPGMRLLWFHDVDSKRNKRGLPDLIIAGPGGHAFAELKADATRGRLSAAQVMWLDTLAGGGAPAYEWRTADWIEGAIQRELHRLARPVTRPTPAAAGAMPTGPATATHRARPVVPIRRCGCPYGAAHTCETWGAPS